MANVRSVLTIGGGLLLAIALVVGTAAISRRPPPAGSSVPAGGRITIEPLVRDLGEIPIRGGDVVMTYRVRNTDTAPLEVRRVSTSCMCTTARVRIGDIESPRFGMPGHGGVPPAWSGVIPSNGEGIVEVTFDPLAHGPNGTGPIDRAVYLETSDPRNPEATIRFSGRVIP